MQSIWKVPAADPRAADQLANAVGVDPITGQLLLNRGIRTAAEAHTFLSPAIARAADPSDVPQMQPAIQRLRAAMAARETILLFGDSDVDGLTATAILYAALRAHGVCARVMHANRIADGYGMPDAAVKRLCRSAVTLVLFVDCGTNQPDAIAAFAAHGIDTIVVDHHLPLEPAARPLALINPFCSPSLRFRELSSAGLAFKMAQALWIQDAHQTLDACLGLAALGLLADYAPLVGEARLIVHEGLPHVLDGAHPGLRRLCEATDTSKAEPEAVVKRLVPRLNASGRLGDPSAAWQVLVQPDEATVDRWMGAVEQAHDTTRQLHRQISGEARAQIARLNFRDQYVLMVSRSGWHQGLMGPIASRLAEHYGRPTIALALGERQGAGSGRSIPAFNLLEALQACETLLVRFGGHAQACGLTVDREQVEPLRDLVNARAKTTLGAHGLLKTSTVDLELPLSAIQPRWVEETQRFAPFGHGNPRPSVIIRRVTITRRSPRVAVLTDGTAQMLGKGAFPVEGTDGVYDVVASPTLLTGELGLAVSDVKASAEL